MSLEEEREIRAKYNGTVKLAKPGVLGVKIVVDYASGLLRRAELFNLDSGELNRVYQPFIRNRWCSLYEELPVGSPEYERMEAIFDYVHGEWQEMKTQPPAVDLRTREWSVPKKNPLTLVLPSKPEQADVIKPEGPRPKRVVINKAKTAVQSHSVETMTLDEEDSWVKGEIGRMNRKIKRNGIEPEEK
jgi:hypothetical protein